MRRIVIAGGSGFLGCTLAAHWIRNGVELINLTRRPRAGPHGMRDMRWDGKTLGDWAAQLDGADAVVNLTGRSVDCRHNARNRELILNSRVQSVHAIGAAIRRCKRPPPVWIQAASLAIYGNSGDRVCDESAPHADDFSAQVCKQWEQACADEYTPTTRQVMLRIGIVLGRDGGALPKLAGLARRGMGGTTGNGRQWVSWLHIDDWIRMVDWALQTPAAQGAYNATCPSPVRNRDFMRELRRALGVWFGPPAPSLLVRVGSFLMGTEASLALTGRRCMPERLLRAGFEFERTDLRDALASLLHGSAKESAACKAAP